MSFNRRKNSATAANGAGTIALDITNSTSFTVTLTGTATFELGGVTPENEYKIVISVVQDATGSRTVTWPASVKWSGGTSPVLSTGANALDIITLQTFDSGTTWYGVLLGSNFS